MNSVHLTEEKLQALADKAERTTALEMQHIANCMECRIKFENYQLINSTLQQLPQVAFDPDLADHIVAMVKPQRSAVHWAAFIAAILGGILVMVSTVLYGKQFFAFFIQLPYILRYFFALIPLSFISVQTVLFFLHHQQKMKTVKEKTDYLAT